MMLLDEEDDDDYSLPIDDLHSEEEKTEVIGKTVKAQLDTILKRNS